MREEVENYDTTYNLSSELPPNFESGGDDSEIEHIKLGAPQVGVTINTLEMSRASDVAFTSFSTRLKRFFRESLPTDQLPTGRVEITDDKVGFFTSHASESLLKFATRS